MASIDTDEDANENSKTDSLPNMQVDTPVDSTHRVRKRRKVMKTKTFMEGKFFRKFYVVVGLLKTRNQGCGRMGKLF